MSRPVTPRLSVTTVAVAHECARIFVRCRLGTRIECSGTRVPRRVRAERCDRVLAHQEPSGRASLSGSSVDRVGTANGSPHFGSAKRMAPSPRHARRRPFACRLRRNHCLTRLNAHCSGTVGLHASRPCEPLHIPDAGIAGALSYPRGAGVPMLEGASRSTPLRVSRRPAWFPPPGRSLVPNPKGTLLDGQARAG